MSWTGTLERVDFGPGAWILRTDDGEKVALYGEIPADLKGKRVQVEGKASSGMGITMVGSTAVEVSKVTAAR